jgi:hypothetical protein
MGSYSRLAGAQERWSWAGNDGFIPIQTKFKRIQIQFNLFQTLTNPKQTFPNSKNLKQNMVVKVLKNETTFSIEISSDPKWILN